MSTIEESASPKSRKSSQGSVTSSKSEKNIKDSPIVASTKRRSEMEEVINHLADMRDKRDEELQALKKTIRECKSKMAELMDEMPSSAQAFSVSCVPCSYDINWKNPATWKLLGGAMLMLYLLSTNLCYKFVPPIPKFYSFLFFSQLVFHLFLTAIAPIMIRAGSSLGLLNDRGIQFYENHVQQHKNRISAVTNAVAIICLKLRRCSSGCGCGSCLQLLITFALFLAEWAAACDKDLPIVNEDSKFDYRVTIGILLNISLTFLL